MGNLRRMHPIGAGEFVDRFESFEGCHATPGFALCAVLFPLCRTSIAFLLSLSY